MPTSSGDGARVGYTRVGTVAQTLEQQNAALAAAGVTKTFSDTISGATDDRPGLTALLDYVRDGDTVVVWKLDRLGRNTVIEASGTITGTDESLHLQVRQSTQQKVVGDFCCLPSGGQNSPWSAQVTTTGTQSGVLTLVVWTGGHAQNVETFAITGVRTE